MKQILFNIPFRSYKEVDYIVDAIKRNHFIGDGYYSKKCQLFIQKSLNIKKVLLTDSCTSALEMSALLIKKNKTKQEIIMPSYTYPSTASAFLKAGHKIIFADIDSKNFMIDIKDVKKKINKNTAAIVVVHYGSFCADVVKFKKLCKEKSLLLIEDAAQGFNSFIGNKAIGSYGDLSCFSFHATKNIHAGLCGALAINNNDFIEKAEYIWERGTDRKKVLEGTAEKYQWVELGGSFCSTEFQAAFLFSQLKVLKKNLTKRKKIYNYYSTSLEALKKSKKIYFPDLKNNFKSNYHSFWILLNSEKDCKLLINSLKDHNIFAYIGYVPLHTSKLGHKYGFNKFILNKTEKYSKQILRLPFHNFLNKKDINKICSLIKNTI